MTNIIFCREFVKHRMYHVIGESCPCFSGHSAIDNLIRPLKEKAWENTRTAKSPIKGGSFKDMVKKINAGYYPKSRKACIK